MIPVPPSGKATTTKKLFSRKTTVCLPIQANPARVWTLLTNAADYPRWNSTVLFIEGTIALGETIALKSTLAPNRVFKLKIKEYKPNERLAWGDALGNRVYELAQNNDGTLTFCMTEKIGGPLFPLFSRMIPDFTHSFESFATDLKTAAEAV